MSGSLQRLRKKISKISDNDPIKPIIKGGSPKWSDYNQKEGSEGRRLPISGSKKLVVSDVPFRRMSKNKSMHFEPKKE